MKQHFILACALALLFAAATAHAAEHYHLVKSISIPGDWSWDYIGADSGTRHVFVSHGPRVEVLNMDTYQIDGTIPEPSFDMSKPETLNAQGVRGGASAPELGRGFVANAHDGSVSIFDLKTLKVLAVVKVGENPDGYVYDPATKRAFTFSNRTKAAAAVDLVGEKLAGTVPLGSKPEAAAADGQGHVFVNLQEQDMVAKIDSRRLALETTYPTAPCREPSSMAMDTKTGRLFIGCRGEHPMLAVMDAASGKIVTTLPIGVGTAAAVFDAGKKLVMTSNGEGSITVIHEESPDKYAVVETVKTLPGARTMALDTRTHKLFLIHQDRKQAPPAAPGQPSPRAQIVPGTFSVLVVAPE